MGKGNGNQENLSVYKISVIIATANRAESIKGVLNSLLNQECDGTFEYQVIVVDNNSIDETKATVTSYVPKFSGRLVYLFEPTQGKSYALNRGIREAKGDIVAFTDDDVVVDSRWLINIVQCFEQYHCDGVGGRVLPVYPKETPQWIKDNPVQITGITVTFDFGEEIKPFDKSMDRFIGSNFAFKREIFEECGLFRTDLGPGKGTSGEDTEFIYRLITRNKILYYCGKALVWHPVDLQRMSLKYLAQWNIAIGRFAARMELESKEKAFVYYFGVPRYLWRGIIQDFLALIFTVFNRRTSFDARRSFFRKVGMIMEYRKQRYIQQSRDRRVVTHA